MFKQRIAFKLIAGIVVMVLISMLAIGAFFIYMFRQYTFDSRKTALLARAQSIAQLVAEPAQNNGVMRGYGGFIRFLDTLTDAKVWITDDRGNPAQLSGMGMGYGLGQPVNTEPLPEEAKKVIQSVLAGQESVSESFSSIYDEATLTVGVPVVAADKHVSGAVLLHAPVTGITETVNKAVGILALSLLAALVPATGLAIFYAVHVTGPLQAMNRSALAMARGNYAARTGIQRQDELGQLGNSLDHLAAKLTDTMDQLFQEEGKLNDIIASISEGLVAFDLSLTPLNANAALSELMHRPLPYPLAQLNKDFAALGIDGELKNVITTKQTMQVVRERQGRKLKFTLSPIIDKQGEVSGTVALVRDISESERLEQLRKDFVANVSHEFRTPLTVIKGSLEALVDGTVNEPADIQRYHGRMLGETKGLERLVGDLLDLSRLQAGKISVAQEVVHLPSLLADAIKSLQTIAIKKGIALNYQQSGTSHLVLGDYDRLRQLFIIFLDNALKYSPENTVVSVEVAAGTAIEVKIQDQGYGIAAADLPYIWDRFYKGDRTRGSSGTGLGLAIAKHLVELHNGQVTIQSEVGKGTLVTVSLPVS